MTRLYLEAMAEITGGSALPRDDIDRMVRDAEQFAEEDRQRREEADTRNKAETLVYSTERFLAENGDKLDATLKADVEEKLGTLRGAVAGTDSAAIRTAADALAAASQAMGQAMYEQAAQDGAGTPGAAGGPVDDDVLDAEIVDEDKEGGK